MQRSLVPEKEKNLEDLIHGWGRGGVCGSWMFVLQLLFIAQAQEGNGRRGGKACGEKTKTVVGLGCPFPHLSESNELGFPT